MLDYVVLSPVGNSKRYIIDRFMEHVKRFDPKKVIRSLKKMDEVWYNGRKPKPSPEQGKCRACPYSKGKCNYSAV